MEKSEAAAVDENVQSPSRATKGGWITFPFIIGTMAGLSLAAGGWMSNLIVYLIQEFNFKSISAAKIYNIVNGSITMFPIIGAIIADSFVGCFAVIWFSSLISLLGVLLLLLTAVINHLRPPTCETGSNMCKYPSQLQLAVLFLGLALASFGNAGTRFTIATMGAEQFDNPNHQGIFFNWYIFTMYMANVVSSTVIVYVQDTVSWTLGFILCAVANMLGLVILVSGTRYYRVAKPRGSPFKSLAQVIVASIRKRKVILSTSCGDYYHDGTKLAVAKNPTSFFRFLNRAAMRNEGRKTSNGTTESPWSLCTVQQVEDLKCLIKIMPLWSTGLLMCIPLAMQLSLAVLQALTMDRHLGSRFKFPAGSIPVFILISTSLFIFIIDRVLYPLWEKITRRPLTFLQRVGIGHVLTVISMAVSALVESKRLKLVHSENLEHQSSIVVPMSVFWLVIQLAIAGASEAFSFPSNVALYYQEFPESLKSTSTAAVAMFIGTAFYVSNAMIGLIQGASGWLPDNINEGRIDNVYWVCCFIGAVNFGYYLVCASCYKYQNGVEADDTEGTKS